MRWTYRSEPHPHLRIDELAEAAAYRRLRFPDPPVIDPGKKWGLTATDPEYGTVMADPEWAALRAALTGEGFVGEVVAAFADDMRRAKCRVDVDKAHLIPYVETREEKEMPRLRAEGDPNALFTRFDFQSKAKEYNQFVHVDWARRLVGGILFFCDADEEGLVGGELALYRDADFKNDRHCHRPEVTARFSPRHNTGVVFLNSNAGFHGPTEIIELRGRRRWVYFTISSMVDIWPHARRPLLRRGLGRARQAGRALTRSG